MTKQQRMKALLHGIQVMCIWETYEPESKVIKLCNVVLGTYDGTEVSWSEVITWGMTKAQCTKWANEQSTGIPANDPLHQRRLFGLPVLFRPFNGHVKEVRKGAKQNEPAAV